MPRRRFGVILSTRIEVDSSDVEAQNNRLEKPALE